ncbi:MAG TPA: GEVED domain-containing protein [Chitinophagaceae bacterium]|nr:GEVED domain-containing protein [Chitinophagaceae bacterium]
MKKTILFSLLCLLFFQNTYSAIFDCNSTAGSAGSSGTRTLTYCITQANLTAAKDTINFSVAGTWSVTVVLPTIIYPLCINGFTAPGAVQGQLGTAVRQLKVVLNGPSGSTVNGFNITASNCEIKGLVIQDFFKGIYIDGGDNNWIWGSYIGTSATGLATSNNEACYDDGIDLENNADNNIIGTNGDGSNDANEGNLIAGNGDGGVQFLGECITLNEIGMTTATNCTGNRISGNFLGTNETGTAALYTNGTAGAQRGSGVQINYSRANIIGTNADGISDALERNVISGNGDNGILLWGACRNKIKGNYIGTTKTGLVGLPNYVDGGTNIAAVDITLRTNSDSNYIGTDGDGVNDNIEGNVIGSATIAAGSVNSYNYGIVVTSTSAVNRISGNYVGIGADGITALSFVTTGGIYIEKCIYVRNSSNNCIVGTNGDGVSDAFEANYVGNAGLGITFESVSGCIMAGNYFGLGTNLTTAETLTTAGAYILNSTTCRVGSSGSIALERNYLCNCSSYGVWIDGQSTANNDLNNVRYNTIGLRPDGVAAGNGVNGVYIYKQSNADTIQYNILSQNGIASSSGTYSAIRIGDVLSSSSNNVIKNNTIYKNVGRGIDILNSSSNGNKISQNSIYNNGSSTDATAKYRLGIDLDWDGVTLNDNLDPDTGPNDESNFPVITGAFPSSAGCTEQLAGTFNGLASTQYYVEIFTSDKCNGDTAGIDYYSSAGYNYGEGKTYIGTTSTFTTDGSGNGNWTYPMTLASISGLYVTATAIQANGAGVNNTSEFSQCFYQTYDCGDAPDIYHTLLSNCGPIHLNTNSNLKIGSTYDNDTNGVPTVNADGDGADEDGISALPSLTTLSTSYTISNIPVTNSSGSAATLYAWLDFNVNGAFQASEFTSVIVPSSGAQNVNLTWSSLSCGSNIIPGNAYLRLRLTTTALSDNGGTASVDERSYGEAFNGEVEDYKIYIAGYDYGDLPNTYPTATILTYEDTATAKVWAGATKPSRECTQKYSADATGDGVEEDGLTTAVGAPGGSYNWVIRLNANQAAKTVYFGLWIDWDGNGNFTSGLDAFYSGSAVVTGVTNKNVSVATPFGGSNAAFRLIVSDAPLTLGMYNATITNGEIEDWTLLRILAYHGNILMGMRQSTVNLLKWKNTSGLPVTDFILERSNDNSSWTTLGTVSAISGDPSTQYSYSDIHPGKENYYRLKFILPDGTYQYSNIVPLLEKNNSMPLIIYPNPATNKLTIQTANSNYNRLQILDPAARLELRQDMTPGNTVVDISNLAEGTHLIKFIMKDGTSEVQRFVKIK